MSELLNCPFCDGLAFLDEPHRLRPLVIISCSNEKCRVGPSVEELPRDQAIAAWNRRPDPSPVGVVGWIHEDELPNGYPYDAMFPHSKVDGVRMFPVYAPTDQQAPPVGVRADDLDTISEAIGYAPYDIRDKARLAVYRLNPQPGAIDWYERANKAEQILQQAGPWVEIVDDALKALRGID